jgi:hypothetical protein
MTPVRFQNAIEEFRRMNFEQVGAAAQILKAASASSVFRDALAVATTHGQGAGASGCCKRGLASFRRDDAVMRGIAQVCERTPLA